jgi:predicted nucleic acid-binding protein
MPVVDASVVIDWLAPGVSAKARAVKLFDRLARASLEIVGPRLLLEEVSNALLTGVRRGRWSRAAADASHGLLVSLPLGLADDHRDLDRAWELARRYDNHPIYDMVYVALAERTRTELVTADEALRRRLTQFAWIVAPDQAAL